MSVSTIMTPDPVTVTPGTSLDEALRLMDEHGVRHLPVIEEGRLVGIVSDRDLLEATGGLPSRIHACRGPRISERVPKHVRDLPSAPLVVIGPEEDVGAAAALLRRRGIGCLPVLAHGALIGLLTELDILQAFAAGRLGRGPAGVEATVADHMAEAPAVVDWHTPLREALALCHSARVRHLPVLQRGQLVGIVSDRDLRRALGCGRPEGMPVGEIETLDPLTVARDTGLSQAAQIMADRKIGALPVVDRGQCVGLLTSSDVLEHLLQNVPAQPRCGP